MKDAWLKEISRVFALARTEKEIEGLLIDLLTPAERDALAERWQIIKRLLKGKTQREIRDELQVSIATVSRGSAALRDSKGSFRDSFERTSRRSS